MHPIKAIWRWLNKSDLKEFRDDQKIINHKVLSELTFIKDLIKELIGRGR